MKITGILILVAAMLTNNATAQKKRSQLSDTMQTLREFVQMSNVYKQLPLYLQLQFQNSTNFITGEQDTLMVDAEFYMLPGTSYIRFGEVEQIVNDSIALLVSDKMQRMLLFPDAKPVTQEFKTMTGLMFNDSSISVLAKKYRTESHKENSSITLSNRNLLPGTFFSKETIELYYNAINKEPLKVISIQRVLLPIEQEEYETLKSQQAFVNHVVAIEGKGYYLVKEQTGIYLYKKIEHDLKMKMPVTIKDRIVKNENGEFMPVKKYENYSIILN